MPVSALVPAAPGVRAINEQSLAIQRAREPGRRRRPKRSAPRVILYILIWAVILGAAGEVLARLMLTSPSRQLADPELGYVNAPGTELFTTSEGFQRLQLNELGLNNGPIAPRSGQGTRIVFVGDSITFAAQVPREANFVSQVGRRLPGVEAINAGRDALGPQQWPALVSRMRAHAAPDLTVIMASQGDAMDLYKARATIERDGQNRPVAVRFKLNEKDAVQEKLAPVLRHSALATILGRRAGAFWSSVSGGNSWTGWLLRGGRDPKPAVQETPQIAEQLRPQLVDILRMVKEGGPVMVVAVPTFDYKKDDFGLEEGLAQQLYAQAAREAGVPYVSLFEPLKAAYAREKQPFNGFDNSLIGTGHLNRYGHAVVASSLVGTLRPYVEAAKAPSPPAPAP